MTTYFVDPCISETCFPALLDFILSVCHQNLREGWFALIAGFSLSFKAPSSDFLTMLGPVLPTSRD